MAFTFPLPEFLAAESVGDVDGAAVQVCSPGTASGEQVIELSQTFTAPQSGTLSALELQVEASGYGDPNEPFPPPVNVGIEILDATGTSLGSHVVPLGEGFPLPLLTPYVSDRFELAGFGLGIGVTAGQVLTLKLTHPSGDVMPCAVIRDGAALYAGGEERRDGTARPDRDLAFRVTIR